MQTWKWVAVGKQCIFPTLIAQSGVRSLCCFICTLSEAALESVQKQMHLSCKLWTAQITFSILFSQLCFIKDKVKLFCLVFFFPKSLIAQVWHCHAKQQSFFWILQSAFMFFLFCFNSLVEVVCGNNVVNCLLSALDWQLSRLGESITVTVLENSPSACVLIWQQSCKWMYFFMLSLLLIVQLAEPIVIALNSYVTKYC